MLDQSTETQKDPSSDLFLPSTSNPGQSEEPMISESENSVEKESAPKLRALFQIRVSPESIQLKWRKS